jgi:hypothetical protein
VVEFGAAFEAGVGAENEPEGTIRRSGRGERGAVLAASEEDIIFVPVLGFRHIADGGHVHAAERLVAFVEMDAKPVFAVGEGRGFEWNRAGFDGDAFAGRTADSDEALGVFGGELEFDGEADGGVRGKAGDPFFPKHEEVVAAVGAADEKGGRAAEVGGKRAAVGHEVVERGVEIDGEVGEAGDEAVVGLGKIEREAPSLRGGGAGEGEKKEGENGKGFCHAREKIRGGRGGVNLGGAGAGGRTDRSDGLGEWWCGRGWGCGDQ